MPGKQGFATLTRARLKEISARGGKKAHQLGKAHKWTSEEAVAAGKQGGEKKSARARQRYRERHGAKG